MTDDAEPTQNEQQQSESTTTVLLALAANVGVGILKLVAGLISGSGALLSEAAHSAGDSSTELLLLTALRRSSKPADSVHPFGYGKERYFWSMLAAVTILVSGATFSIYQGIHTIISEDEPTDLLWINYPVLALAFVLEGISFRQAVKQAKGAAEAGDRSFLSYLRDPDDPTVKSVVLEDSAALVGLVIAGLGVGLHQITGSGVYDGVASLLIGVLLVGVAFALARTCMGLLIGKQADLRTIRAISDHLEEQPEIIDVVDVLTMLTGVHRILLCTRVDFVDHPGRLRRHLLSRRGRSRMRPDRRGPARAVRRAGRDLHRTRPPLRRGAAHQGPRPLRPCLGRRRVPGLVSCDEELLALHPAQTPAQAFSSSPIRPV